MAEVLLRFASGEAVYQVLKDGRGHFLVQERGPASCRSYRITRAEFDRLRDVVLGTYHKARLRRKARRRANGGKADDKLVPAS
ncbi:MAG: hypothetical protein PWQ41_1457 [Bacillota bacterium]|nr:hypothetical protein [Bacillota bacterium]MDK2960350.1 hypothetical protein [Bacillota bacterium]